MEIDWVTVSAQIVNFLILVWLLKRFLYRPVLRAMDRREQGIRERLRQAGERERDAEGCLQAYREQQADLERRREALLEAAREEAEQTRHRLLQEARAEVARRREDWQRQLDAEREDVLRRLGQRSLAAVEALARRALHDLAGAGLEAQLIEVFIERLSALDSETRQRLARGEGPLHIATSFTLSPALEERLIAAVHRHLELEPSADVSVSRSTSLICGIELIRDGRRLGWSLADYLDELHDRVDRDLRRLSVESEVS
ncbi:hypothetical protein LG302_03565 [Halomonas organivorans]